LHEGQAQPPEGAGSFENGAGDLRGHLAEKIEVMAVMLNMADVHLDEPRTQRRSIDEQPDVHAVVVFEMKALQQFLAHRDDAAQRLLELHQFREICSE
jgi:hypothetical protein